MEPLSCCTIRAPCALTATNRTALKFRCKRGKLGKVQGFKSVGPTEQSDERWKVGTEELWNTADRAMKRKETCLPRASVPFSFHQFVPSCRFVPVALPSLFFFGAPGSEDVQRVGTEFSEYSTFSIVRMNGRKGSDGMLVCIHSLWTYESSITKLFCSV